MTQQYAPAPAGAQPIGGPDDEEERRWNLARDHQKSVERHLGELRARGDAARIYAAECAEAEQVPAFDAGLLDEVLARPDEPPHRAEGIIPADAGTLLIAQRKTGKTTTLLNLARALLNGDDFLGQFPVTPVAGRVAFLNYEVSAAQLARWAHDAGVPPDRLFLVNLRGRRNPLGNPRDRTVLAERLRAYDVETLIVDPFGRAYTGASQNDAGDVGTWLADLDRFARGDVGARDVILTAHAGWNGERSRGSTALEDWADSIITITRDKEDDQQRFLRAEGRDILVAEDRLDFDPDTRHLALTGTGSRRVAARTRQVDALIPTVLELLAATPSMSGNQLDTAIKALISSGDLDAAHSKGDGAKAAQILERRGMAASKAGKHNARLFTLLTSPTSLNLPQGSQATSPGSPYRGEVAQGGTTTTTPTQGTHTQEPT